MSKKQKIIYILVFIACFMFQILPVIKSGLHYDYGRGFWGSNGHDAVWHLSLINHITNPLKINLPIFSGKPLNNYHPFYDIFIAFLSHISTIDSSIWYFQIFPIISTVIFLFTSYKIGQKITGKYFGGLILVFLNTFANSLGWIVSLIKSGDINGESLFWAMQSPSNQLNPPYFLSLIFINFLLLILLSKNNKKKLVTFLIIILLSITPITKSYGGVAIYLIYGFYALFNLKKDSYYFKILLISIPISFFIFSFYNQASSSVSVFIYQPFWFVNSLIESPDRLYIPLLANIRYSLETSNRIGPRLLLVYLITTILFYLGNFSWRLLGILSINKGNFNLKLPLFFTLIITSLIPLFFIQQGTSWNTIQFMYYSLFIGNIFLTLYLVRKSNIIIYLFLPLIIISNLIASYENIKRYLSNPAPAALPSNEVNALTFLKNQTSGLVLTFPYDKFKKNNLKTPIPLYAYETTAYVSAFSQKNVFLEDEMNLNITGYDWQNRRKESLKFFSSKDKYYSRGFLINNNIQYIYLVDNQKIDLNYSDLEIDKIYDKDKVLIYKVRK